jgi:tetratricopeptide (TPR) repeat protein
VRANPGDPALQRLRWRVLLVADRWKEAIAAGDTLVQLDTAQADSTYFVGTVAAYQADSNVAKAAETAARGVAKFPNNATLGLVLGQLQRQQGQLQQALTTLQRVATQNPKTPNVWLLTGQTFNDLNQPDSAMAALSKGLANGEDSTKTGQMMVVVSTTPYRACSSGKDVPSCRAASQILARIDTVTGGKSVDAAFRLGHVNVLLGQALLGEAYKNKSCEEAKQAQVAFVEAQVQIPKGGRNPLYSQAAGQLMNSLMQLSGTADKQVQAFCK